MIETANYVNEYQHIAVKSTDSEKGHKTTIEDLSRNKKLLTLMFCRAIKTSIV